MTTDGPLDERYLTWLYSLVNPVSNRNPARSHWLLISQMYKKEFLWVDARLNDDNRIGDGLELREEFVRTTGAERDEEWMALGCSVLEMLIALSRRLDFETQHDAYYWFWRIIDNLTLLPYVDEQYDDVVALIVDEIWDDVINRTYHRDGSGGMFPLRRPRQDQRRVEIWYQMSAYLLENGYE